MSRFFDETFSSHIAEKFCRGTRLCFRNFRVSEEFMHSKGISLNSVEKFLSLSADKFPRRTLLCFKRIFESKIFKQKRGKLQGFIESFVYLTGPKKLRQGTILSFTIFLVVEKIFMDERVELSRFSFEKFLSQSGQKISLENNFVFQTIFYFKTSYAYERGGITVLSNFFVSQDRNEKFCIGHLLFSRKYVVTKKFMHNSGITFLRQNLLVSQCPKFSWASLQCFRKIGVSKNFMHNREYQNFPSKNDCFTVPKNFVKEPNSVSLFSGFKKCWG